MGVALSAGSRAGPSQPPRFPGLLLMHGKPICAAQMYRGPGREPPTPPDPAQLLRTTLRKLPVEAAFRETQIYTPRGPCINPAPPSRRGRSADIPPLVSSRRLHAASVGKLTTLGRLSPSQRRHPPCTCPPVAPHLEAEGASPRTEPTREPKPRWPAGSSRDPGVAGPTLSFFLKLRPQCPTPPPRSSLSGPRPASGLPLSDPTWAPMNSPLPLPDSAKKPLNPQSALGGLGPDQPTQQSCGMGGPSVQTSGVRGLCAPCGSEHSPPRSRRLGHRSPGQQDRRALSR